MGKLRTVVGVAASAAALGTAGIIAAPAADATGGTPCSAQAKACIDLSAHHAWLMNNGHVTLGPKLITVGRPGHETPTGTFHVQYKDIDHWSRAYNGPMPYSVFFTNTGIAFHEGSLSVPSHGCVHLSHDGAVRFYDALEPGDVVEVHE